MQSYNKVHKTTIQSHTQHEDAHPKPVTLVSDPSMVIDGPPEASRNPRPFHWKCPVEHKALWDVGAWIRPSGHEDKDGIP